MSALSFQVNAMGFAVGRDGGDDEADDVIETLGLAVLCLRDAVVVYVLIVPDVQLFVFGKEHLVTEGRAVSVDEFQFVEHAHDVEPGHATALGGATVTAFLEL